MHGRGRHPLPFNTKIKEHMDYKSLMPKGYDSFVATHYQVTRRLTEMINAGQTYLVAQDKKDWSLVAIASAIAEKFENETIAKEYDDYDELTDAVTYFVNREVLMGERGERWWS